MLAALLEGSGKNEDGICAAHLGVDGDGIGAGGGEVHEGAASAEGAGEADGADAGVLYQRSADFIASVEEQREEAGGKAAGAHCGLNDAADELAGAGMGRMGWAEKPVSLAAPAAV